MSGQPRFTLWILRSGLHLVVTPARDAVIAALGPEQPGIPPGPSHRPGQPCLACHDELGGAEPLFSIAGTVYRQKDEAQALGGTDVELVDPSGKTTRLRTNCAGNFYVTAARFQPRYPLWVTLATGGERIEMDSPIYRDGFVRLLPRAHRRPALGGARVHDR